MKVDESDGVGAAFDGARVKRGACGGQRLVGAAGEGLIANGTSVVDGGLGAGRGDGIAVDDDAAGGAGGAAVVGVVARLKT